MLKTKQHPPRSALRASLAAGTLLVAGAAFSAGCLDRPVVKQEPNTSNVFVDQIVNTKVDKIDLLFVIDNSVSMSDKQQVLRDAVPVLVERLVNPSCKHRETGELVPYPGDACPDGYNREFDPIEDIHIGVVTSSLGGHGGSYCAAPVGDTRHPNDRAELLVHVRPELSLPAHHPAGFLQWRGSQGTQDKNAFIEDFTRHVTGAGETGCGFEATLEAWYRFLIDPEPPVDMARNENDEAVPTDINGALLEQRAAFLRPDSLVAIIMLSDENDCSIRDGGFNWIVNEVTASMWAASEKCDEDPNDPCCYTCALEQPPNNCQASTRCQMSRQLSDVEDDPNLRCFNQKQRFGVDFLYPASRYIQGLTELEVPRRDNTMAPNPLFQAPEGVPPRDRGLVFLAGIIGVPWQDIATEESLTDPNKLVFLTAEQLTAERRWDVILGEPNASPPVRPTDPLMWESIDPRSGANPITGDQLVTWDTPLGNRINGHEYNIHNRRDLQYACIFPLEQTLTPDQCSVDTGKPEGACDCISGDDATAQKPLCFPPNGGGFSTTQYWAKAYPGTRFLEVLKGFGNNSIVASICPKHPVGNDPTNPNVGYNPAVAAIVDRLSEALKGSCLPRRLDVDDNGNVPCSVVEVVGVNQAQPGGCGLPGRSEPDPKVLEAVRKQLRDAKYCDDSQCSAWQICAINPVPQAERDICLFDVDADNAAPTPGYCYIDPGTGLAGTGAQGDGCGPDTPENCSNPNVADRCPPTSRRLLRFVGNPTALTPAPGSTTFVACVGSAL